MTTHATKRYPGNNVSFFLSLSLFRAGTVLPWKSSRCARIMLGVDNNNSYGGVVVSRDLDNDTGIFLSAATRFPRLPSIERSRKNDIKPR